MNSPSDPSVPRVALVTPSFWPVSNHLLASVLGLAEGWSDAGAKVTIITERLEPSWSTGLRFCDYDVVRVDRPSSRPWGRGRFAKLLVKALQQGNSQPQVTAQPKVTAQPQGTAQPKGTAQPQEASRSSGQRRPWDVVVVCAWPEGLSALQESVGSLTDQLLYWLDRPPQFEGRRTASLRSWKTSLENVSAVLSPHPAAGRWLSELGFEHKAVEYVPESPQYVRRDFAPSDLRQEARKTLAEIHPLLNFERNQLVALCAAELNHDEGFLDLLAAWRMLRREEPRAQLLIVGEGPQGRVLWQRIHDWHLQGNVVMPGCFDDLSELFRAVDFVIHPLRSEQSCPFLTAALRLGKASVMSSASPWAGILQPGREAWIYPSGQVSELFACLRAAAGAPAVREALGRAGGEAIESKLVPQRQVERFRGLLQLKTLENLGAGW